MANPRIKYDIDEIDEILDLYKKQLKKEGKLLTEFKSKSVSNFNKELVDNNVKRKNGKPFTLYKYHFWAGKQAKDGEYNYGKKRIMQKNDELSKSLEGEIKDIDIQDILCIIEKNYKNPTKMTNLICNYIRRQKKKTKRILDENIKLSEENQQLKNQLTKMDDCFTNIFFNSQFPNNSLNDMMTCQKSNDKFIQSELNNMFSDGLQRIEMLTNINYDCGPQTDNQLQNIINLDRKKRGEQRVKEAEDEGF